MMTHSPGFRVCAGLRGVDVSSLAVKMLHCPHLPLNLAKTMHVKLHIRHGYTQIQNLQFGQKTIKYQMFSVLSHFSLPESTGMLINSKLTSHSEFVYLKTLFLYWVLSTLSRLLVMVGKMVSQRKEAYWTIIS